jgi:hypothetical protein
MTTSAEHASAKPPKKLDTNVQKLATKISSRLEGVAY